MLAYVRHAINYYKPTTEGEQKEVGCIKDALRIVKQHQSTAPQDRTQAPDQSPRNECVSVDGLAMPINVTGERPGLFSRFTSWVPQLRGPACPPREDALWRSRSGALHTVER